MASNSLVDQFKRENSGCHGAESSNLGMSLVSNIEHMLVAAAINLLPKRLRKTLGSGCRHRIGESIHFFSAETELTPKFYVLYVSEGIYSRLRCKKDFLSERSQKHHTSSLVTVTMTSDRLLRRILPTIKAKIDGINAVIGDCK